MKIRISYSYNRQMFRAFATFINALATAFVTPLACVNPQPANPFAQVFEKLDANGQEKDKRDALREYSRIMAEELLLSGKLSAFSELKIYSRAFDGNVSNDAYLQFCDKIANSWVFDEYTAKKGPESESKSESEFIPQHVIDAENARRTQLAILAKYDVCETEFRVKYAPYFMLSTIHCDRIPQTVCDYVSERRIISASMMSELAGWVNNKSPLTTK